MVLSDLSLGCSNKSGTVRYNKNATSLTTQGCNNIAISCWNNLVTSLIISTRLLTACSKLVDGLLADLLQDVRFLRVWLTSPHEQYHQVQAPFLNSL
jgi:hypothetical protein